MERQFDEKLNQVDINFGQIDGDIQYKSINIYKYINLKSI